MSSTNATELELALRGAFDLFPDEFKRVPSWSGLARVLDVDPSQVSRYRTGETSPRRYRKALIAELAAYALERERQVERLKATAMSRIDAIREYMP